MHTIRMTQYYYSILNSVPANIYAFFGWTNKQAILKQKLLNTTVYTKYKLFFLQLLKIISLYF
jgi:hypothetical protein